MMKLYTVGERGLPDTACEAGLIDLTRPEAASRQVFKREGSVGQGTTLVLNRIAFNA